MADEDRAITDKAPPDRVRKRRVRSGCMRCRVRRRKCDEGKPRCGRCSGANADCQYGPRLSFLEKNALTLSTDHVTAESPTRPDCRESRFQFVDKQNDSAGRTEASSHSPEMSESGIAQIEDLEATTTTSTSSQIWHRPPDHAEGGGLDAQIPMDMSESVSAEAYGYERQSALSPSRNYPSPPLMTVHRSEHDPILKDIVQIRDNGSHIATDALLSLGRETAAAPVRTPGPVFSPNVLWPSEPPAHSPVATSTMLNTAERLMSTGNLSTAQKVELFRHFRYEISPWLDMCDKSQSFGLLVTQLAMRCESVFEALVLLSGVSSEDLASTLGGNGPPQNIKFYINAPSQLECLERLASLTLFKAQRFIRDVPRTWEAVFAEVDVGVSQRLLPSHISDSRQRRLWLALLACLAKLEVANSLVNGTDPIMASWIAGQMLQIGHPMDSFQGVMYSAHRALTLCAEVMEICFDRAVETPFNRPAKSRAEQWKALRAELMDFYVARPPELCPTTEMEHPDSVFPVVFFASGVGIFANTMYHTAMLLLLESRPRTVRIDDYKQAHISPLWHAKRICGIALNNDRSACWDPCLLGAFYTAARRMTHEVQQEAILSGLRMVKALGWRLDSLERKLLREWNPSS